ncbi:MAG: glycosidase [Armatimonadota bacterium]|nr:MAG: glycosidase [Armatimonadota bacterium]
MEKKVFKRHGKGPLLTPDSLKLDVDAVFNPGVAEVDGEVVLLLRIEDRTGISQIRVARSANGIDKWQLADHPLLDPDLPENPFEEWGCEDARVTRVGEREWMIAYTAYSRYGPAVALAKTSDFDTVERIGVVLSPTNKDAAVFPRSFDGVNLLLHRPVTGGQEHIWFACSDEGYSHWSQPGILLAERGGPWWDGLRIGVGAPPIETKDGWLLIYHGVKDMAGHPVYRLGLALLDTGNPRKAIARASRWVFAPEEEFEQRGLLPNVVYTCGALVRGDDVWMYYGAADNMIGLALAKMSDLLRFVREHDYLQHVGREKGMVA